jgi:2-methylcitrate dehydratase PrpD
LAHSLDYDDTHLPSILHPSASIVPAVLAAAEACQAEGADVVAAIAVGLEICVRLGMAGFIDGESLFFARGQHATSICGAIGAAAAVARVRRLPADQIAHSMGIAVSMAGGVIEANRTGGTVKRLHCGWAAHSAVVAASLASRGITGPPTVLEGRFGFFEAFIEGTFDPSALTDGLGTDWVAPTIFFKPYPANHFTHTAIDAALELRSRGIGHEDIESIHLGVATSTVRTIGEPLEAKQVPETGYQAQFSGPYVIAAALLGGSGLGLGLADFTDELATDPLRRSIMARVTVGGDERCDAIYPMQFPAVMTVRLRSGEELVIERLVNRGGPGDPLSDEELGRKFADNAGRCLDADAVEGLRHELASLGASSSVGLALAPLRAVGVGTRAVHG